MARRDAVSGPLTLRQPIPNVVTMRDVLIEAALQTNCSILDLTTHVPGQRARRKIVQARAAVIAAAHDVFGYSFREIAGFLNRPITTVRYLYTDTVPRGRARRGQFQRLLTHLNLFASGIPTTRIDLTTIGGLLDPSVPGRLMLARASAVDKMVRMWLLANTNDEHVYVGSLAPIHHACGATYQATSRLLARYLDSGVLEMVHSDHMGVRFRLDRELALSAFKQQAGNDGTGASAGVRETAMNEMWRRLIPHDHHGSSPARPGPRIACYPPIHQPDPSTLSVDRDPKAWDKLLEQIDAPKTLTRGLGERDRRASSGGKNQSIHGDR